jgi:hypothetical protein
MVWIESLDAGWYWSPMRPSGNVALLWTIDLFTVLREHIFGSHQYHWDLIQLNASIRYVLKKLWLMFLMSFGRKKHEEIYCWYQYVVRHPIFKCCNPMGSAKVMVKILVTFWWKDNTHSQHCCYDWNGLWNIDLIIKQRPEYWMRIH